jgi:hypothetical protein
LTSSDTGSTFADSDAEVRWYGLARHRLLLLLGALGVSLAALVTHGERWWEWCVALALALLAAPGTAGRSCYELVAIEIRFWLRRRVTWSVVTVTPKGLVLTSRHECRAEVYELSHRGRLDLSGHDTGLAARLTQLVEAIAEGGVGAHVALHVESREGAPPTTTLSTTSPIAAAPEWRRAGDGGVPRTLRVGRNALLERRDHLRTRDGVLRTLRVGRFAPGRETSGLAVLGEHADWLTLSVHVAVVPTARARRLTARAVHRVGSDAQVTRSAGFRWSARREWELDALRQREQAVAAGAALCQWALYLVVRASSLEELRARVDDVMAVSRATGLRLDVGSARQREYFEFQLPGGPGW